MPSSFSDRIDPTRWEIDASGFLRMRTRVLSTGVMRYTRAELGEENIPPTIKDAVILLAVMPDSLGEPRAIRSLEGMPCTVQHPETIGVDDCDAQVGSIAGAPVVEGPYLCADMRITDSDTIAQIVSRQLVELSSGYVMEVVWENGEYDGSPFHGKQTKLRYEHVALLREGEGRAGPDVRVLNRQTIEAAKMPERTQIKIGNRSLFVANEQAQEIVNAVEEAEESTKKATTTAFNDQLTDISRQLQDALAAKQAADDVVAQLQGQLSEMKTQLETAMSPDAVEAKADAMNAEREEAATVMNAKNGLPPEIKKLSGHALRVAAINSVRVANKQAALTDAEQKDEPGVKGRWAVMVENAKAANGGKHITVTGAGVTTPGADTSTTTVKAQNAATDRFTKLYPEPKKAS